MGFIPPPTRLTADMVWWGERKGRVETRDAPAGRIPETECILVVTIASSNSRGGRMVGRRFASMDLPVPGGPINRLVWDTY